MALCDDGRLSELTDARCRSLEADLEARMSVMDVQSQLRVSIAQLTG
jgi:hypothetical protein